MANPFFNALRGQMQAPGMPQMGNPMGGIMQALQQFSRTGQFPGPMQQQYEAFRQRMQSAPPEDMEKLKSLAQQVQTGNASPAQMQQLVQQCAGYLK